MFPGVSPNDITIPESELKQNWSKIRPEQTAGKFGCFEERFTAAPRRLSLPRRQGDSQGIAISLEVSPRRTVHRRE